MKEKEKELVRQDKTTLERNGQISDKLIVCEKNRKL